MFALVNEGARILEEGFALRAVDIDIVYLYGYGYPAHRGGPMFYADTVLGGSSSALRCGLDFFGADKVVFASDCPFDPEGGPMYIREGIRSVEDLKLSDAERRKIYFENAMKLLGSQPKEKQE